jgi:hypothetical protein
MLVNCQAHEGQPRFTENAGFRVHLNRAMRDLISLDVAVLRNTAGLTWRLATKE